MWIDQIARSSALIHTPIPSSRASPRSQPRSKRSSGARPFAIPDEVAKRGCGLPGRLGLEARTPGAAGKVRLVLSTLQRVAPVRRVWLITCRVADRLMHSGNCVTCDFVPHQCQARQDNVLLEAFPRDVLCFALGIIGPLRCSCPPVCRGRRESAVPHFMVKRRLRRSASNPTGPTRFANISPLLPSGVLQSGTATQLGHCRLKSTED